MGRASPSGSSSFAKPSPDPKPSDAPKASPKPSQAPTAPKKESAPRSPQPAVAPPPPKAKAPYRESVLLEPVTPSWLSTLDSELVFKVILGVGGAALFVWLLVWLFTPNTTVVSVGTMTWNREKVLQERHSYAGEGWRSQAPGEVYSWDHCETRQNGTENCNPHECDCRDVNYECNCTGGDSYECNCTTTNNCSTTCSSNSNGSATCSERCSPTRSCSTCRTPRSCSTCSRRECSTCYDQCPVYAEWCSYHYYRWDQISEAAARGNGHGAVWPDLSAQGPLQRIVATELYSVQFTDTRSHRVWVRDYPFSTYERFDVGQHWNAEWTRAGGFTLKGLRPVE